MRVNTLIANLSKDIKIAILYNAICAVLLFFLDIGDTTGQGLVVLPVFVVVCVVAHCVRIIYFFFKERKYNFSHLLKTLFEVIVANILLIFLDILAIVSLFSIMNLIMNL